MGKLQAFQIAFDKNKDVYSPGESITGTVTIKLGQQLLCKAIKVNCNGFCGITNKVNDLAWMMEEQYFNSTFSLADKGTLKEGEHTFPFKFLIPASAPTSFEGSYGRIIYRVRAFIDTPRFAKDYSTEKPFFLLSLLNLNELPDIWGTCSSAVTQQFTYMLMKTGTVVLKAQTDMKGYTPGQVIQVIVGIHNESGKTTGNMAASLMQRVTYEMKRPTYDVKMIAEVEGGVVKAGKEVEWKEQIIVPPIPQSSLAGCELIKIDYYVKVSLKSPDVTLTLPIHIGNISLDKKKQSSIIVPKQQPPLPLLQLKIPQPLPLPLTPRPLPLPPHCPPALPQNLAPRRPPIIPPVLLQLSTVREQRVGLRCMMASPISDSLSSCHPTLSAMLLASFLHRTSSTMGLVLYPVGPQACQHLTPLATGPSQCQHHSSCLQPTTSHLIHKVSWHTLILCHPGSDHEWSCLDIEEEAVVY
uniref:Arrestin C-terminal-like domain-containing protein n=1 Tax=Monopterus albus TaxID=43700 RepID=A0A3Q3IT58_MONAL